jgi:hypothetical protein
MSVAEALAMAYSLSKDRKNGGCGHGDTFQRCIMAYKQQAGGPREKHKLDVTSLTGPATVA